MAGFQSTKGDPAGRETAEKPYKKGVFTRWRHIAPAGKGGAYQVLLRPATPGRPPLVTFFLYTHLSISISRISPDEIYCSRGSRTGSQGWPTMMRCDAPGGSRGPPAGPDHDHLGGPKGPPRRGHDARHAQSARGARTDLLMENRSRAAGASGSVQREVGCSVRICSKLTVNTGFLRADLSGRPGAILHA